LDTGRYREFGINLYAGNPILAEEFAEPERSFVFCDHDILLAVGHAPYLEHSRDGT
jgi:hypothetical protein